MAGSAGKVIGGAGGPITHTAIDQAQIEKTAVERAIQQRGIASEEPMGGITSANSLDNFQKIEKRMQTERNYLNESK